MQTGEHIKRYLKEYYPEREYWRAKNRFYYEYLDRLTHFLVPEGKSVYILRDPHEEIQKNDAKYDYIVVTDLLGFVYDIENFFRDISSLLTPEGRIVIIQYNTLWEPVLRLASFLKLRAPSVNQNWISPLDIQNFLVLAGYEPIRKGAKMLVPKYIPLISAFFNNIVANLWPFTRLGLIQYCVARRAALSVHHNPSISIVVPARNEAGTIERIANELPALGAFTEIIFVEGHSTDNTLAEIERVVKKHGSTKRLQYAVQGGKGKGDAVRQGFAMATGDILAIYDADMTVPPGDVEKFYRALVERRGDFINGSRLVYPLEKQSMRLLNYFANKFFSFAFSAILGQPIKDTLCGTKVLWKKDYEAIAANRAFFGDFDPFGDFDLIFGAVRLNLKIIDVPIHYKDRTYGVTNISRFRHGWLLLKMTLFAARKLKFL